MILQDNNKLTLIIDGTNMFIRCYDMLNPKYSVDRYLMSFGAVLRQILPTQCIVVFDSAGSTKRRKSLYSEYKATRNTQAKYSMSVLSDIQDILKLFPIKLFAFNNTQADDIISELSKHVATKNKVLISSSDQDFLQLVDQNIKIWQPIKKSVLDEQYIIDKFGIHPKNFIIYKVLVGDKSDNIPGISGIGLKTLVKHYGNILKQCEPINGSLLNFIQYVKGNPSPIQQKIIQGSKQLITYYKIMNLSQGCISPQTGLIILQSYNKQLEFKQLNKNKIYNTLLQKTGIDKKTNILNWVNNIIDILQR